MQLPEVGHLTAYIEPKLMQLEQLQGCRQYHSGRCRRQVSAQGIAACGLSHRQICEVGQPPVNGWCRGYNQH